MENRPPLPLTIQLLSASRDRALAAVNLAAAALALGRPVQLFLAWDALASYCAGGLASFPWAPALAGRAQEPGEAADLDAVVARLRADGLRLYACSGSLRILGLDEAALAGRVDGVSGATALLAMAADGPILSL